MFPTPRLKKKPGEEFKRFSINALIHDTIDFVKSETILKKVQIETSLTGDLPDVSGDRIQIQQVLLNLLTNAFDAVEPNPPGERYIRIESQKLSDNSVMVSVIDTGSGIDNRQLDSIFDPFFSTKSEGMGLGLAISRFIIKAHGGKLTAGSDPEGGTILTFTLHAG